MFIVPVTRDARQFSRLFDDTLERFFAPMASDTPTARNPALDVAESDRAYTAKLENGVLTLTLPKRSARSAAQLTVN